MIAPLAVEPVAAPMTPPTTAPPEAPITAPFCFWLIPAQPPSTTDPAMTSAPSARDVCFIFIAPFLEKRSPAQLQVGCHPLETLSHSRSEFPGTMGVDRTCDPGRQRAVE